MPNTKKRSSSTKLLVFPFPDGNKSFKFIGDMVVIEEIGARKEIALDSLCLLLQADQKLCPGCNRGKLRFGVERGTAQPCVTCANCRAIFVAAGKQLRRDDIPPRGRN